MIQDIRFALRQLRRAPAFTLTATLTLAFSIGAATAMYSIVQSTVLAPLPYPHPEELVGIGFEHPGQPPNNEQTGETADMLLHDASSLAAVGIADDGPSEQNLSADPGLTSARTIRALRVSSGYFAALDATPVLGHTFTHDEDLPGATPTVVLSESIWRGAFGADPEIAGRVIHINGDPYTVIGVVPSTFATVAAPDVWQPLQLSPVDPGYVGDNYQVVARLRQGVSPARASQELNLITQAIYRRFPKYLRWGLHGAPHLQEYLWPLQTVVVSESRSSILALSAAVAAVLLMACINLAGLVTSRSINRRPELALRASLGAGRAALLRLLLAESLLLAFGGLLLGLALSQAAVPLLIRSSPVPLPQLHQASTKLSVIAFAVAATLLTVSIFGLWPSIAAVRGSLGAGFSGSRVASRGPHSQRFGRAIIVAQVALATTLLSAGALMLSAFLHMRAIPSGVRAQHLYALQVNLKGESYANSLHAQHFVAGVEGRLRQMPGVERVAAIVGLPLDRGLNNSGGPAGHPELVRYIESRFVTPGYFNTAGMTILAGTDISPSDTADSQPVALINRFAAEKWFHGRDAVGEFIVAGGGTRRVIGIVSEVHGSSLVDTLSPTVYLPYAQVGDETMKMLNGWFATSFVLRAVDRGQANDPNFATGVRAAVAAVDPGIPAARFSPMQRYLDKSVAAPRFFSWLAGGFALFALLLTVVGLFGLLSYQVSARTRELGVRMALGAQRSAILALILRNGLLLTAIGLVLGIAGSFTLRSLVVALLSDAIGHDHQSAAPLLHNPALVLTLSAVAMVFTAIAACILPARRAAALEPTEALRAE